MSDLTAAAPGAAAMAALSVIRHGTLLQLRALGAGGCPEDDVAVAVALTALADAAFRAGRASCEAAR